MMAKIDHIEKMEIDFIMEAIEEMGAVLMKKIKDEKHREFLSEHLPCVTRSILSSLNCTFVDIFCRDIARNNEEYEREYLTMLDEIHNNAAFFLQVKQPHPTKGVH